MGRPLLSAYFLRFLLVLFLLLLDSISVYAHGGGDDDDADAGGSGEAEAPTNLRARGLVLVKIWCLILVFVGTFVGGISPYFFKWNEGFLALGTQFAGGVFFGTALMHFLSDAVETFEGLTKKEYPFAFMLAGAGYLLTMLADCVIAWMVGRQRVLGHDVGAGGGEGVVAEGGTVSGELSSDFSFNTLQFCFVELLRCPWLVEGGQFPIWLQAFETKTRKPSSYLRKRGVVRCKML